jgi:chromosome segregation ATPase
VTAQGVQIAEGREKQAKTEAELKSLHRRISTLEDQLREARRAATQAIAAKRRSDEQILALELELHQVQAELNQTSAKLTLSEAARKKLQLRIDELEDQLADLRANLGAAATPITQPIDLDSAAAVEAGLPTVEG